MKSSTDAFFREVLDDRTSVASQLEEIHGLAWEVMDSALLDLCRLRVAMLLHCDSELEVSNSLSVWSSSSLFSESEKACLRFTEEFIIDVSSIPDSSAFAVRECLGEEGFVNFVNALLVVEQRIRLQIVWRKIREEVSV